MQNLEHANACSHLGESGMGACPHWAGNFLRIHPSEVKSGVNLEQKLLDYSYTSNNNKE